MNDLKQSDTWKIQLRITIFFFSEDDNDDECVLHSRSDKIKIVISDEADEVIKKNFDLLKNRYQNNLQSVRGSEFGFIYVELLYHKCHKIKSKSWWIIYRFS